MKPLFLGNFSANNVSFAHIQQSIGWTWAGNYRWTTTDKAFIVCGPLTKNPLTGTLNIIEL